MKAISFRAGLAILAMFASVASAHSPATPIRIIVPIPPGGARDVAARVIGPQLAEQMGQTVIIDKRTGANGNIAGTAVAKSSPEGLHAPTCPGQISHD